LSLAAGTIRPIAARSNSRRTWSATRAFVKHHRTDPVGDLVNQLASAWGGPQQIRLARWPVTMRVGRV